jgi:hypothetical protein
VDKSASFAGNAPPRRSTESLDGYMASSIALRDSWAVTLRHLSACRYYLPESLGSADAIAAERELIGYLHHNEFGLALESAAALGRLISAPREFWMELRLAADNMGLAGDAERYARLSAV